MFSRILRFGVTSFLTLALITGWLHAQGTSTTYGVLVGINKYPDAKIKPRVHAEADVQALHAIMAAKDHLGADPKNLHLLLAKDATRANIMAAIGEVVVKAKADDLVFFAFFGQGGPVGDQVGFFGADATAAGRAKDALLSGDIAKKFEGLKSHRFCAFLDINMNEFEGAKDAVRDLDLRSLIEIVGDPEAAADKRPKGRVMFLASLGLKKTLQLEKQSLFGQVLIDAMKGKADREGYESDGAVTADELIKYVDEELPKAARAFGKTKEEKGQSAVILSNPPTHFTLSRTPTAAQVTEARLAKFRELAKKQAINKEISAEGMRFLVAMPLAKYQQSLRKNYQSLADGDLALADFLKSRKQILDDSRLPKDAAAEFAGIMNRAVAKITDNYFREIDGGTIAAGGIRGLFLSLHEPIPEELAERLANAKGLSRPQIVALFSDAREQLRRREDLDNKKAEEITLQHIFSTQLDKYCFYVNADEVRKFRADTSGGYTGIGVLIRKDTEKDMIMVVSPIRGSPAYNAGIQTGDWIREIRREVDSDGRFLDTPEVISGVGLSVDEAVKKIIGRPGTKVRVSFEREGAKKPIDVELIRAPIRTESLFGVKRKQDDTWDFMLDSEKKIGYARIGGFTDSTHLELGRAIADLKSQGMNSFILDLRFCPGGKLDTAIDVARLFIKTEQIVSYRSRSQFRKPAFGNRPGNENDFPMAVLVNRKSASASELVSACWQDHKRAVIVGDRSFGKGTVVTSYPFDVGFPFFGTGGVVTVTTATFWRPSGKNLEKITTNGREDEDWGVIPNEGYRVKIGRHEEADLFDHLRKQEVIPRRDLVKKDDRPFRDVQLEKAIECVTGGKK